jgi:hypothetical protein
MNAIKRILLAGEYQASLKKYPNPPGFSMTRFATE